MQRHDSHLSMKLAVLLLAASYKCPNE